MELQDIKVKDIYSDDVFNCRGAITPLSVVDLAKSIETNGLLNPIIIEPYDKEEGFTYRILAGHRRFAAIKLLHWEVVKAIVREGLTELQARILNLNENLARKDLTIIQEAKSIKPLMDLGMKESEIVQALAGTSRGWIQVRMMLLRLPEKIQAEADAGILGQANIRDIYTMQIDGESEEKMYEYVRRVKDAKIRGENVAHIRKTNKINMAKAKIRGKGEIINMIDHILDVAGSNFGTRALAWAAGEIKDGEMFDEIRAIVEAQGKTYIMPEAI